MSAYESVRRNIYNDPAFEDLSLEASALYLWSFINPLCNWSGLYRVSRKAMLASKVSPRKLAGTLTELEEGRFLFYAQDTVWVRSRIKYLYTRGHKIGQTILREVSMIGPQHPLRAALIYEYCEEHGDEYPWLRPLLKTLEYVPHTEDEVVPQTRVSVYSKESPLSLVVSSVAGEEGPKASKEALDDLGFEEWLAHHEQTTGLDRPGPKTEALKAVRAAFRQRRQEDYSLEDLQQATIGAYNDKYRQEHGYFTAESVLRPTKVHDLIAKAKARSKPPATGQNLPQGGKQCARASCQNIVDAGRGAYCESCSELIA